jgi:hypothetical protein
MSTTDAWIQKQKTNEKAAVEAAVDFDQERESVEARGGVEPP